MTRRAGEPGGPDDRYCIHCGHSWHVAQKDIAQVGFVTQECWVEDFTDEGASTATQLRHKWPEQ